MHLYIPESAPRLRRKSFVGQGVLILLGIQMFFFSAFCALDLPTATGRNLASFGHAQLDAVVASLPNQWQQKLFEKVPKLNCASLEHPSIRTSLYSPQVPVSIFCGYVLGPTLGVISATMFVVLGLLGPFIGIHPLAEGGGLMYYTHPGFGYLLGMILGTWVAGRITLNNRTSLTQLAALAAGLASVHVIGVLYLLGCCLAYYLADAKAALEWQPWVFELIRNLTWYQLPYDVLFGLALVGIGFPFRWLVHMLTSADIASKTKAPRNSARAIEELV